MGLRNFNEVKQNTHRLTLVLEVDRYGNISLMIG